VEALYTGFLFGDTISAPSSSNTDTWAQNGVAPHAGEAGDHWINEWKAVSSSTVADWTEFVLIWDNTGGTTPPPGETHDMYLSNPGLAPVHVGENLRVGFSLWQHNGGAHHVFFDEVSVFSGTAGVVPKPATLSLVGIGALAMIMRRKRK